MMDEQPYPSRVVSWPLDASLIFSTMPPLHGLGYRLVRCASLTGKKICKANCECKHGVSGVGEAGRREDRAAADIDVARAVEKKVGSDDAIGGRCGHAHPAHVVIAVVATIEE